MAQVREVAEAVKKAQTQAGITDAKDVHYVQVKGPLLTPAAVADADKRGAKLVTRDPNGSKPYARGATALGVALGLGEVAESALNDSAIAQQLDIFSTVANTSAGGELRNCEILLFGNSPQPVAICGSGMRCFAMSSMRMLCSLRRVMRSAMVSRLPTHRVLWRSSPKQRHPQMGCCAAGAPRCFPTQT